MQLRPMTYASVEGTEVQVQVNTSAEAKTAIKELRHRKKELGLLKKRLQKSLKANRTAVQKATTAHEKALKKGGITGVAARVGHAFRDTQSEEDAKQIEKDLANLEEVLTNIDSCIIQIEGRLL
jgi:exonuclease VII small subunit